MRDAKTFGPYSSNQLKQHALDGRVAPEDRVAQASSGPWTSARKVKGLQFAAEPPPPINAAPPPPSRQSGGSTPESSLAVMERPMQAQTKVVYVQQARPQQQAPQHMYVTTQRTGKGLKMQSLLSTLMIIVGLVWSIAVFKEPHAGEMAFVPVLVLLFGLFWFAINRVRIWWHHD